MRSFSSSLSWCGRIVFSTPLKENCRSFPSQDFLLWSSNRFAQFADWPMYTISCEPASIRIYRPGPAGARWVFSGEEFHRCSTRAPSSPGHRVFLSDSAVAGSALRPGYPCGPLPVFRLAGFLSGSWIYDIWVKPAKIAERGFPAFLPVPVTGENFPSLFSRLWQHQAVHRNTHFRNLPRPSMPRAKGLPCGDRSMASARFC